MSYAISRRHCLAGMGVLGFGSLASPAATAAPVLEDANQ
jgi:hypothetical protein